MRTASVYCYEGLHVQAALASEVGSRRGADLARFLDQPMSRPAASSRLNNKPVGQTPWVYLGQANGVTLDVVARFAA